MVRWQKGDDNRSDTLDPISPHFVCSMKQMIEQLGEGDQYADLNPSISICLLDSVMFRGGPVCSTLSGFARSEDFR